MAAPLDCGQEMLTRAPLWVPTLLSGGNQTQETTDSVMPLI